MSYIGIDDFSSLAIFLDIDRRTGSGGSLPVRLFFGCDERWRATTITNPRLLVHLLFTAFVYAERNSPALPGADS